MSMQQRSHAAPQPGRIAASPPRLLQGGRQAARLDLPPALHQLVRQVAEEVAGTPAELFGSSTLVAVGTCVHGGETVKTGRLQLLRLRPYCSEVGGQRTTGRYMCSAGACAGGTCVHGRGGRRHERATPAALLHSIQGHVHHRCLKCWRVPWQVTVHHAGMLKRGCDKWMTTARSSARSSTSSGSCRGSA